MYGFVNINIYLYIYIYIYTCCYCLKFCIRLLGGGGSGLREALETIVSERSVWSLERFATLLTYREYLEGDYPLKGECEGDKAVGIAAPAGLKSTIQTANIRLGALLAPLGPVLGRLPPRGP